MDDGTIAGGKDKATGIIDIAIVNSLTEKGSSGFYMDCVKNYA